MDMKKMKMIIMTRTNHFIFSQNKIDKKSSNIKIVISELIFDMRNNLVLVYD